MKINKTVASTLAILLVVGTLSGCTKREATYTLGGAALGTAAGYAVSGGRGSGAAVGAGLGAGTGYLLSQ